MRRPRRNRKKPSKFISSIEALSESLGYEARSLTGLALRAESLYGEFHIERQGRKPRRINPPKKPLKLVQRSLLEVIYELWNLPKCIHGGVPGHSIIDHAGPHVGRHMVATVDIRDFFPSTDEDKVLQAWLSLGVPIEVANILTGLTTYKGHLPQGSPTSTALANLVFLSVDRCLIKLCRKHRLKYSRYVDDIAISGDTDFKYMKDPISDIICSCGYEISPGKFPFMPRSTQQLVTGLIVNDKMRPSRTFINDLKRRARLCLEYGAATMADLWGVTVKVLKDKLNGRLSHLERFDEDQARIVRRRLYGVDWSDSNLDKPVPNEILRRAGALGPL